MRSDKTPDFYETYDEGAERIERTFARARRYVVRGSTLSLVLGAATLYSSSHFKTLENSVLDATQHELLASGLFKILGSIGIAAGAAGLGLGCYFLTEWRENSYRRLEQETQLSSVDLRKASLTKNKRKL